MPRNTKNNVTAVSAKEKPSASQWRCVCERDVASWIDKETCLGPMTAVLPGGGPFGSFAGRPQELRHQLRRNDASVRPARFRQMGFQEKGKCLRSTSLFIRQWNHRTLPGSR
jgi:hypothetical protein